LEDLENSDDIHLRYFVEGIDELDKFAA